MLKRFYTYFIVVLTLGFLLNAVTVTAKDEAEWIPDENLRRLVVLEGLTELDVAGAEINDLTGLERLTRLKQLNLRNNEISDVSALSGLTGLETLNLADNELSDVSALSGLTGLKTLDLRFNGVVDMGPLANLTGLKDLYIFGNPIEEDITALQTLLKNNPNLEIDIPLPEPGLMPDEHLAEAVREALGLAQGRPFTREALQSLTELSIRSTGWVRDAINLAGLEHATGLEKLTLERLRLYSNEVVGISALSGLTGLKTLSLYGNGLSDVSALSNLTGLETLNLSSNKLSDVSALANLTGLKTLALGSNELSDVSALSGLTGLEALNLSGNLISDVSALANLTGLKTLALERNELSDVGLLANLTGLETLYLSGNQLSDELSDVGLLSNLTGLKTLHLYNNVLSDVSALSGLTGLKTLDLRFNGVVDVGPLTNLTGLETLYLGGNELSDVGALSNLTGLKTLNLADNELSDVSALSGLTGLETLNLADNELSDVSALSGLTGLETLNLADNELSDVGALSGLTGLETLNLSNNQLSDVGLLANLMGLKELSIFGNPIEEDITALQTLLKNNPNLEIDIPLPEPGLMPDEHLAEAVREALGLAQGRPFTREALQSLTELSIRSTGLGRDAINLAGLEHATGLEKLTLERLRLYSNEVVGISALSGLTGLKTLDLQFNGVVDVGPLTNLTGLETLYLGGNEIRDVSALSGLTGLKALDLTNNEIRDVSALSNLTGLEELDLRGNPIQDIAILYTLRNKNANLRLYSPVPLPEPGLMPDGRLAVAVRAALDLASGSSFTPERLEAFTSLNLSTNQITDLTGLEHATGLERLYLRNNELRDVSALANLTGLKTLDLQVNAVVDVGPLANLTGLETLDLYSNKISDVTALATLKGLKALDLDTNQLSDITPLAQLTNLDWLELQFNQITDVSVLSGLTNLEVLLIKSNPIQDVTPLRTLLEKNSEMTIDVGFVGNAPCPVMYWVDMEHGTLHRRIGEKVEPLPPDIQNATSLALNGFDHYWIEETDDKTWMIRRLIRKRGTGVRIIDFNLWSVDSVRKLTDIPMGMAIADSKIYVSLSNGKIQRLDVNGGNFEGDFITGLAVLKHIVVDIFGEKLYWTEEAADGTWRVGCAALDGSNIETVQVLENEPRGLAVDGKNGNLYMSVSGGKIQRLSIDGSAFDPDFLTGLSSPRDIGVDILADKLYWTETEPHVIIDGDDVKLSDDLIVSIRRASLSGENIEEDIENVVEVFNVSNLVLDVRLPTAENAR